MKRLTGERARRYKKAAGTVETISTRSDGTTYARLVNKSRRTIGNMLSIPFSSPTVPTEPTEEIKSSRTEALKAVEDKLRKVLEERPVWTRTGLINQLEEKDGKSVLKFVLLSLPFFSRWTDGSREECSNKQLVSLVSYTFSDGPFRELCVRWGYDPRKDSEARLFVSFSPLLLGRNLYEM